MRIGPLVVNAVVGLAIAGILGAAFELWRRRRAHWFQLFLGELLLVIAVVSGSLAYARHVCLNTPKTEELLGELSAKGFHLGYARGTPEFIHALLPGTAFKPSDRVVSADIYLEGHGFDRPLDVATLRSLGDLECVRLFGSGLSDAELSAMGAVRRLRQLGIYAERVTDNQLIRLADCQNLEELTVHASQIRGSGLADLAALPRLRSLDLDMSNAPPGSTTLVPLGNLIRLRRLTLHDQDWRVLTQKEITALAQLTELEELAIYGYEFDLSDDPALLLRSHPKLTSLKLGTNKVPDELFAELPSLRQLETLMLSCDHLTEDRVALIGRCRSLRQLRLFMGWSGHPCDTCLRELAKVTSLDLQRLDLSNTSATDAAVDSLAAMRSSSKSIYLAVNT
jgi:Leucine-rich repeat (LRR) protein